MTAKYTKYTLANICRGELYFPKLSAAAARDCLQPLWLSSAFQATECAVNPLQGASEMVFIRTINTLRCRLSFQCGGDFLSGTSPSARLFLV